MISPNDLLSLKDDMIAFIAGHGMRRIPGYIGDDVPTIVWEDDDNPDSWKDFVEAAKTASAPLVTMSDVTLEKEDLELLLEELQDLDFPNEESADSEEAQSLVNYVGKMGYIQLGFIHQGVAFVHESSTTWYEHYQQLLESVDDFGNIVFEEKHEDEDE